MKRRRRKVPGPQVNQFESQTGMFSAEQRYLRRMSYREETLALPGVYTFLDSPHMRGGPQMGIGGGILMWGIHLFGPQQPGG